MERSLPATALPWRVLGAWADLRGSMRAELDRSPSEGLLLVYAMLSGLIWFLGRAAVLSWGPSAPFMSEDEYTGRLTSEFAGALFFRTLAFYGLAGLAGWIARMAGGAGSWRDSRAALFWAALVAAPLILAATLASLLFAGFPGQVGAIAGMFGAVAFAWAAAQCIAEAHGFVRAWKVLAAVAVFAVVLVGAIYLLLGPDTTAQAAPLARLAKATAAA